MVEKEISKLRYIVKNCDNFIPEYSYFDACCCKNGNVINGAYVTKCADVSSCLIKQIVEKCKNTECDCLIEKRKCGAIDNMPMCCDLWKSKDILSLLDIEDVE